MQAFAEASRIKSNSKADTVFDLSRSALMSENPLNMKSQKAIAIVHKLMTRAINEGREAEMIEKIARRITKIKNWAAQDAGHIAASREMDKLTKSPTLRVFNFNAMAEGRKELLADDTGTNAQLRKQEASIAEQIASRTIAVAVSPRLN